MGRTTSHRYRRLALLFAALALLSCQPKRTSGPVKTLAHFEASDFFHSYGLTKTKTWLLSNGHTNNVYEAANLPDVGIELETGGDEVVSAGLMFFKRDVLGDRDLEFVYDLLGSIEPGAGLTPD